MKKKKYLKRLMAGDICKGENRKGNARCAGQWLYDRGHREVTDITNFSEFAKIGNVIGWNDAPGTTRKEIADTLNAFYKHKGYILRKARVK